MAKSIKNADGSEIILAGEEVSYHMKDWIPYYVIQVRAQNGIWMTTFITIHGRNPGIDDELYFRNSMQTYLFSRREEGFVYVNEKQEHPLDNESSRFLDDILEKYRSIKEWERATA